VTEVFERWNEPAIRVLMMPRDTNAHGTIFGGVILSYIDQAGAIEARRQGSRLMLTVSMDKIVKLADANSARGGYASSAHGAHAETIWRRV